VSENLDEGQAVWLTSRVIGIVSRLWVRLGGAANELIAL